MHRPEEQQLQEEQAAAPSYLYWRPEQRTASFYEQQQSHQVCTQCSWRVSASCEPPCAPALGMFGVQQSRQVCLPGLLQTALSV